MDRATALRGAAKSLKEQKVAEKAGRTMAAKNARIRAANYAAIAARHK